MEVGLYQPAKKIELYLKTKSKIRKDYNMKQTENGLDSQTNKLVQELALDLHERMQKGESMGISGILQELMNALMKQDRNQYLLANQGDDGNGFYERILPLTIGKLDLKVPRVRLGSKAFRPAILPARWKRVGKEYEELLIALLSNNYSHAQIKRACEQLGLPFSQDALNDALALIEERLNVFKTQIFEDNWLVIFIDAYHARLRAQDNKVIEISLFSAVGITMDGKKHILGFWTYKGSESKGFWTEVFQQLIGRGVSRVLMFVTDNFPGISDVIKKLYPYSDHQLCHVHLVRNLVRNLTKKSAAQAIQVTKLIKQAREETEGEQYYDQLCEIMQKEKPQLAEFYRKLKDNYLAFLKYPQSARKFLYTTNAVESINAGIEKMRLNLGGYFPSSRALDVNLFIQLVNLEDLWERKPIWQLRECLYELRQLFDLRFEMKET
jgi:transposase-like protein